MLNGHIGGGAIEWHSFQSMVWVHSHVRCRVALFFDLCVGALTESSQQCVGAHAARGQSWPIISK